jgi:hypothetical protein
MAYRAPGARNVHPLDAELNLPEEKQSHGLRKLAAIESPRGSRRRLDHGTTPASAPASRDHQALTQCQAATRSRLTSKSPKSHVGASAPPAH